MAMSVVNPGIRPRGRDPRMTILHAGAMTIAVLSGTYALVALFAGSPLEFGVALALCGAGWIAADFIEWTLEWQRAARSRPVPPARPQPGYGSDHLVFVGAGEYSWHPNSALGPGHLKWTPTAGISPSPSRYQREDDPQSGKEAHCDGGEHHPAGQQRCRTC